MKVHNILYLTDEYIYLKHKTLIKYKMNKDIIKYGKIYNVSRFINTYNKLIKEYNLNNSILGENIKIIVTSNYTNPDIIFLKNIFITFNYRKVVIDKEIKYYKLNNSKCYINAFSSSLFITYIDEYKQINSLFVPFNLFINRTDLVKYVKYRVDNKEIYLLGNSKVLNDLFNTFESIYGNKVYTFSESENYVIMRAGE